jgi:glycosyltransferase involved in cell wall biosynthesis
MSGALVARGHRVRTVDVTGDLEPRDPVTRRPRPTPRVLLNLALATARFGRLALGHRWNTTYWFDHHARRAGEALRALPARPDVVLQNGALFAPGAPPPYPYALLIDHTRALAMRGAAWPDAGIGPPADYGRAWRAREAAVYRGARAIGTFSENAARSLARDYDVDPSRVHVVGAGANVLPEHAPRVDDGHTILFVGREFQRKGGPHLAEAFRRLRRAFPRARLLVAGPAEAPPLPEGAAWLGEVPLRELPALFARTTVFALPTLREPFGLAFLDAMACAVPCVGTSLEAVPEIVRDGETGLLVPPGDVAALAGALARLLADPARGRAMGARGRERVLEEFRWDLVAERLERALVEAVAPREAA